MKNICDILLSSSIAACLIFLTITSIVILIGAILGSVALLIILLPFVAIGSLFGNVIEVDWKPFQDKDKNKDKTSDQK